MLSQVDAGSSYGYMSMHREFMFELHTFLNHSWTDGIFPLRSHLSTEGVFCDAAFLHSVDMALSEELVQGLYLKEDYSVGHSI